MAFSSWRLCARYLTSPPGVQNLLVDTGVPGVAAIYFAFPGTLPEFYTATPIGGRFPGTLREFVETDH
jgi:hypothetical protein